jgi:hypothetical protein
MDYTLPPLAHVAALADLEEWIAGSAPGARCVYAVGLVEPRAHPAWQAAQRWAAENRVTLVSKTDAQTRFKDWMMIKRAAVEDAGATLKADWAVDADWRTLRSWLLEQGADACAVQLPSHRDLAARLGWRSRDRVRYILERKSAEGLIALETLGDRRHARCFARLIVPAPKGVGR